MSSIEWLARFPGFDVSSIAGDTKASTVPRVEKISSEAEVRQIVRTPRSGKVSDAKDEVGAGTGVTFDLWQAA
jgi:hypothetical protein